MRTVNALFMALSILTTSAVANTGYMETVTAPVIIRSGIPQGKPVIYDVSRYNYPYGTATPGLTTITFASAPAPYIFASAMGQDSFAVVRGEMQYDFYVTGPALSLVPVNFLGVFSMSHQRTQSGGSSVSFRVLGNTYPPGLFPGNAGMGMQCLYVACESMGRPSASAGSSIFVDAALGAGNPLGPNGATGSFYGTVLLATDASGRGAGQVVLEVWANAGSGLRSTSFIDPQLSIDSNYLLANPAAGLSLPPGVGNEVSAVPEPESALLMLCGLFATGLLARRGRAVRH